VPRLSVSIEMVIMGAFLPAGGAGLAQSLRGRNDAVRFNCAPISSQTPLQPAGYFQRGVELMDDAPLPPRSQEGSACSVKLWRKSGFFLGFIANQMVAMDLRHVFCVAHFFGLVPDRLTAASSAGFCAAAPRVPRGGKGVARSKRTPFFP
jgi:hypothetical protein